MLSDSTYDFTLSFRLSQSNTVEGNRPEEENTIQRTYHQGYILFSNQFGCVIYPPRARVAYQIQGKYVIFFTEDAAKNFITTQLC